MCFTKREAPKHGALEVEGDFGRRDASSGGLLEPPERWKPDTPHAECDDSDGATLPVAEAVGDPVKIPDGVVDVANGVAGVFALGALDFDIAGFDALLLLVLAVLGIGDDAVVVIVRDRGRLERGATAEHCGGGQGEKCQFVHEFGV